MGPLALGGPRGWVDHSCLTTLFLDLGQGLGLGWLWNSHSQLWRAITTCQVAGCAGVKDTAYLPWYWSRPTSFRSSSQKSMLRMVWGPRRR